MVDWENPTESTYYTEVLEDLKDRDLSAATGDYSSDDNIPTGAIRYNRTTKKHEEYSGTAWAAIERETDIDNHIADTSIHFELPAGIFLPFGGTSDPSGWLICDGRAISRSTYAALFAVIGSAYGAGDGSTTFNIPDMRGRFALGKAASGTGNTMGASGGSIDHTHTGPSHTHDMANHTHTGPSHTHDMQTHTHTIPAHAHGLANHRHAASDGGGALQADIANDSTVMRWLAGAGSFLANRRSGTLLQTTVSEAQGGAVAVEGYTAAPNTANTDNSSAGTTSGISNNTTTAGGTGATGAPSTNTTSAGGTGASGANNPPYLVCNYIIKT